MIPDALDRRGLDGLLALPGVRTCLDALASEGEETRLVGGCVRDALLGRDVADIDLATTLTPAQTMQRAKTVGLKAVPTGFEHGTVTLVVDGAPFEVTTLREDIETDGRHAVVRFGRDFHGDAERRDFTINALSLSADGQLHDTTNGVADLAAGRVRFIGDAATRIREDSLRILRFFRFHARYGRGEPDRDGLAASIEARASLARLSRERVRAELLKILLAPGALAAMAIMSDSGLLARVTGGVGELGRLARATAVAETDDATVLRLAALAVQTREDAERLGETLRLSKAEQALLASYAGTLAALRNRADIDANALRALAADHGPAMICDVLQVIAGEPRPQVSAEAREALDRLAEEGGRPVLPISGADLVARGLAPGPAVGAGLAAARAVWLAQGCPTDEAARDMLLGHALAAVRR